MSLWTPDPTIYPSPRDAAAGPAETLAYVAAFDRAAERPGAPALIGAGAATVLSTH
jgi:selenium-binding protein 1